MILLAIGFLLGVCAAVLWRYLGDCLVEWMEEFPAAAASDGGPTDADPLR